MDDLLNGVVSDKGKDLKVGENYQIKHFLESNNASPRIYEVKKPLVPQHDEYLNDSGKLNQDWQEYFTNKWQNEVKGTGESLSDFLNSKEQFYAPKSPNSGGAWARLSSAAAGMAPEAGLAALVGMLYPSKIGLDPGEVQK